MGGVMLGGGVLPIVEESIFWLFSICLNAVVLVIFISSADDFFIDLVYLFRRIYRSLFIIPRFGRSSASDMRALRKSQKPIAILIPAWEESAVIGDMLIRAVRDIRYDNYKIFIGIYQNDLETRSVVEDLIASSPELKRRVIIAQHLKDGPTSKADCLNGIVKVVMQTPWVTRSQPAALVLHDAEDIVHPSELVVFNHLIEKADIIQLPVVALPLPLLDVIGGHYLDEFAESHAKDLVVREALGCPLPSAGVGCAFSYEAIESLALMRGGDPFDDRSVTEDYDVALDLAALGYRSIFVRLPSERGGQSFVATQEYFPRTFKTAVKQKARWLLGIALQSWQRRGWRGSLTDRYMLWRDRKSVLTALTAAAAYSLILIFSITALLLEHVTYAELLARVVVPGGIAEALIIANLFFLLNRIVQRFIFVYRCYGFGHALMTPFRILFGNFVNVAAAYRAVLLFRHSVARGARAPWSKTDHKIPGSADLIRQPGSR